MASKPKAEKKPVGAVRPYKTTIRLRLVGTKPLLFNPATEKLLDDLQAGHNPGKDTRPAKEQAEGKLERDGENYLIIPRRWVFASLRGAGKGVPYRTSRDRITSATQGTKLPSLIELHHAYYVIHDGEGSPIPATRWEVDRQKGNNKNSGKGQGTAVCIIRPRIDPPWGFDLEMTVRTDRIDIERIIKLVEVAGEENGLGDGRPEMGKLDYGMFKVVDVEILGTQKAPPRLVIRGLEKMTVDETDEKAIAAGTLVLGGDKDE